MRSILYLPLLILLFAACTSQPEQKAVTERSAITQSTPSTPAPPIEQAVIGQIVYVPIYSHIYYGNKGKTINLTATLSVRNTDPAQSIVVKSVDYYDTEGKLIKHHLAQPLVIGPMATREYIVEEDDISGGSGANFLVDWYATNTVSEPIIEAVMISTSSTQGISFISTGRVIKSKK
jgi:hypothetical protein